MSNRFVEGAHVEVNARERGERLRRIDASQFYRIPHAYLEWKIKSTRLFVTKVKFLKGNVEINTKTKYWQWHSSATLFSVT